MKESGKVNKHSARNMSDIVPYNCVYIGKYRILNIH